MSMREHSAQQFKNVRISASTYSLFNIFLLVMCLHPAALLILAQDHRPQPFTVATTRPKLATLSGPICTEFCHQKCEKYRHEHEPQSVESDGRKRIDGSEKVDRCKDANRKCDCGPKPDTFHPSHCAKYCWRDCTEFFTGYGVGHDQEELEHCMDANRRCSCGPNLKDPYREPTEKECEVFCYKKCDWRVETDEHKFCTIAKPKCICKVNPVAWIIGPIVALAFGFLSCFVCQRYRSSDVSSRRSSEDIDEIPQVRFQSTFLPVIPPTPIPQPEPVRRVSGNSGPGAPTAPLLSTDSDLPPSYVDVGVLRN